MSKNEYNREILSLVMDEGVSIVLQEYIVSLVRAGYFDEEKIFELIGGNFKVNVQQKKVIQKALDTVFTDLRDQTSIKDLRAILELDIISEDPVNKPIGCIKLIRGAGRWGLKETKEFFDFIKPELLTIMDQHDLFEQDT